MEATKIGKVYRIRVLDGWLNAMCAKDKDEEYFINVEDSSDVYMSFEINEIKDVGH